MTNGERADRLVREARQIAGEMSRALDDEAWNLTTRRGQEALELAIKALLNEMSVEYPKTHDPAPVFAQAIRARGIAVDELFWTRCRRSRKSSPRSAARPSTRRPSSPTPRPRLGPARRARSAVRGGLAQAVAEGAVGGLTTQPWFAPRAQGRRAGVPASPCSCHRARDSGSAPMGGSTSARRASSACGPDRPR